MSEWEIQRALCALDARENNCTLSRGICDVNHFQPTCRKNQAHPHSNMTPKATVSAETYASKAIRPLRAGRRAYVKLSYFGDDIFLYLMRLAGEKLFLRSRFSFILLRCGTSQLAHFTKLTHCMLPIVLLLNGSIKTTRRE
jgi:hypothetical protein